MESRCEHALRRGEAPILVRYHGKYAATTVFVLGDREGWAWEETPSNNFIDDYIHEKLKKVNVSPSGLCDDADFLRRVHFDNFLNLKNFNPRAGLGGTSTKKPGAMPGFFFLFLSAPACSAGTSVP